MNFSVLTLQIYLQGPNILLDYTLPSEVGKSLLNAVNDSIVQGQLEFLSFVLSSCLSYWTNKISTGFNGELGKDPSVMSPLEMLISKYIVDVKIFFFVLFGAHFGERLYDKLFVKFFRSPCKKRRGKG